MPNIQLSTVLSKYLPIQAVGICVSWITGFNIHLKITKNRASKFGDYRPHPEGKGHLITVNHNLNPYAFLITFIHEVAHLVCVKKHSRYAAPHGKEWKGEYTLLLNFVIGKNIFPSDIEDALRHYAKDPAASSCTDEKLLRILKKYDPVQAQITHLEELPQGAVFRLSSSQKMIFVKGELMRKRFQCIELRTKAEYRISGLVEVIREEMVHGLTG